MEETKKYYVVFGTEENFYEGEVEEFDSYEEAEQFENDFADDCEGEGYGYWIRIASSESERDSLIKEIEAFREEEIAENFGEEED